MKRITISGIKILQLVESGKIPANLKWHEPMPATYFISVFEWEDGSKSIIACGDAFGGNVSWAEYNGKFNLIGKTMEWHFDKQESDFLNKYYPKFKAAVEALE